MRIFQSFLLVDLGVKLVPQQAVVLIHQLLLVVLNIIRRSVHASEALLLSLAFHAQLVQGFLLSLGGYALLVVLQ